MGQAFPSAVTYHFSCIRCCSCTIPFWVPDDWEKQRRLDKATFYCPNGHGQSYTRNEADRLAERLRKMLEDANRSKTDLATRLGNEQSERAKLERKLKRVGRGTCPDCNRSFQNLARHMCTKHGNGDHGSIGKKPLP